MKVANEIPIPPIPCSVAMMRIANQSVIRLRVPTSKRFRSLSPVISIPGGVGDNHLRYDRDAHNIHHRDPSPAALAPAATRNSDQQTNIRHDTIAPMRKSHYAN